MDEENKEEVNLEEEFPAPEELDEADDPQDKLEELQKSQKAMYEKYKAERTKRKELEEKTAEKIEEKVPEKPTLSDVEKLEERINLKVDLRVANYSQDEISFIETYAKGQGKSLTDVLETKDGKLVPTDPFLVSGIQGMRETKKAEQSTPPPSSRTPAIDDKKRQKMSAAEREQNFSYQNWKTKRVKTTE